jgi:mitogen-activated protein kinase kinase kinase
MNGGTDITRQNSFAKHEDVWAVRPPAEVVLDNLENFFPNHDLDKPILVDHGNMSPPISPADASDSDTNATIKPKTRVKKHNPQPAPTSVPVAAFPKPTARMKSIRVVAKEAIEKRSRLQSVALGIKGANLLRRKSTKVWGARMLEMTPGQVRLGQIITPENNEDGLERRRIVVLYVTNVRDVQVGQG